MCISIARIHQYACPSAISFTLNEASIGKRDESSVRKVYSIHRTPLTTDIFLRNRIAPIHSIQLQMSLESLPLELKDQVFFYVLPPDRLNLSRFSTALREAVSQTHLVPRLSKGYYDGQLSNIIFDRKVSGGKFLAILLHVYHKCKLYDPRKAILLLSDNTVYPDDC